MRDLKLRIGLLGFGRTGRLVADEILKDESCELTWVIRRSEALAGQHASRVLGHARDEGPIIPAAAATSPAFWDTRYASVDLVIDFSDAAAIALLERAAQSGIRLVSAISHYASDQMQRLQAMADRVAVLHSANITIGINYLLVASQMLRAMIPEADVEIVEEHFREKKGVSGTALKLADALRLDRASHVNSIRVGGVVGKHEVIFGLPNQTIRLVHESINRSAFGRGALFAAKWIANKPSGFYTMEQIIRATIAAQANVV